MWWLIGSAPDFWGRGQGFVSGTSHNDPNELHAHCVFNEEKAQDRAGNQPLRKNKRFKKIFV